MTSDHWGSILNHIHNWGYRSIMVVISVTADVLVLSGAKKLAVTMMTKFLSWQSPVYINCRATWSVKYMERHCHGSIFHGTLTSGTRFTKCLWAHNWNLETIWVPLRWKKIKISNQSSLHMFEVRKKDFKSGHNFAYVITTAQLSWRHMQNLWPDWIIKINFHKFSIISSKTLREIAQSATVPEISMQQHAGLTELPLDKMAATLQMTYLDAFLWMKSFVFWLKFNCS